MIGIMVGMLVLYVLVLALFSSLVKEVCDPW